MRLGAFTCAAATSTLVLGAVVSLAPGQNAPSSESKPSASSVLKFDHDKHAALENPVEIANCGSCHGSDKGGVLAQPAQVGHQPCFSSGCHADDFLSVGVRTQKSAPERYAKASAFCQGCHASSDGRAPLPSQKARADNTYRNNANPGHYVEFNHLEHTERAECRSCHVVNAETFALELDSPAHVQCATCHKDNEEQSMTKCASCHRDGSPSSYFKERKVVSDVRSCRSDRYRQLDASKKRPPCFEHERKGHRFRSSGQAVQCKDCHFMFESKSYAGHNYQSLLDIKQAPLMDNARDRAHQKCGSSGCHSSDVNESQGTGRCDMCHSKRSILSGLVDGNARPSSEANDDTTTDEDPGEGKTRPRGNGLGDLLEDEGSSRKKNQRKRRSLKDLVD